MKLLRTLGLSALMLVGARLVTAQHIHGEQQVQADTSSQQGMMQSGMMEGMMGSGAMGGMHETHMQQMDEIINNPFKHSDMLVRVLPTMSDALALSDEQASSFEDAGQRFKELRSAITKNIVSADEQLESLLASTDPDADEINGVLRESAMHRVDLQMLAFETASKMRAMLTDEQQQKLAEITPMQMHHHMMMNMTMMEMMQIMTGGMMSGMSGEMMGRSPENGMHDNMPEMHKSGMMNQ